MTMRFFPQSFELSTLGGWIATRAGGHFATRLTHIDDLVESVRAITPTRDLGVAPAARVAAPGRAPTGCCSARRGRSASSREAWVRVQPRPAHRASRAVRFDAFLRGAEAVRAIAQSGLDPSNCRLIDELEARADRRRRRRRARCSCSASSRRAAASTSDLRARRSRSAASTAARGTSRRRGDGGAGAWREAFIRMPYLRDMLMRLGVLADTFETAITWDRLGRLPRGGDRRRA